MKAIKVWLSPYLKDMRDRGVVTSTSLYKSLEKQIDIYKELKRKFKAAERANLIHKLLDAMIEWTLAKHPQETTCRKGCAYCCYMNVDVTWDEAQLLLETKEPDWSRATTQLAGHDNIKYDERACVYLNDDRSCGVYDQRPMACRKYLVISDPELCNIETNPKGDVLVVGINQVEILTSGMMTAASDSGSMAEMLLKVSQFNKRNLK